MATPTLPKLKAYLNIDASNTVHDNELGDHFAAARRTMRERCGPDEPTAVTDETMVTCGKALLFTFPVISLTSAVDDDGNALDVSDAKLRRAAGLVEGIGGSYSGMAQVTYQAGYDPCPDDLELAIYIVAGHLWETQRGSTGAYGAAQGSGFDEMSTVGTEASNFIVKGFALPRRAMELSMPYTRTGFA